MDRDEKTDINHIDLYIFEILSTPAILKAQDEICSNNAKYRKSILNNGACTDVSMDRAKDRDEKTDIPKPG